MSNDSKEIAGLIGDYRNAALTHGSATEAGDHQLTNRAHDELVAIYREIKKRGGAGKELLNLLQDPEPAVRLWAAAHALEFAPEHAEAVLAAVAKDERGLLGFTAQMTLQEWKKGRLRFP